MAAPFGAVQQLSFGRVPGHAAGSEESVGTTAQGVGFNRLGHGVIDMLAMLGPVGPWLTELWWWRPGPEADGYG